MITFNIAGQELSVSSPVIVSETKKYITASFTFSSDWNDITDKILHYYNGETYYSIPIVNDELTPEDNFQLSNGLWKFYIHGINQNGVRITTTPVFLTIKEFGNFEGELYPDAPQHIVDRLLLLIRTDGDGTLFLANDGTYKGVTVSSQEIAEAVESYLETHPVAAAWGNISGSLENQTDLAEALADLNEAISSIVVPSALSQLLDDSEHRTVTDAEKSAWNAKADSSALSNYVQKDGNKVLSDNNFSDTYKSAIDDLGSNYQAKLVSGTNIKTINNESILGSGNITVQGSGSGDSNYRWQYVEGTVSLNKCYKYSVNELVTLGNEYCCVAASINTNKVRLSGYSTGNSYCVAYCFLDENDNILGKPDWVKGQTFKDVIIDVPNGATKIYVNGNNEVSPHLEVAVTDIRSDIHTLPYLLDDLAQKIMYRKHFAWKPMPKGLIALVFDDSLDENPKTDGVGVYGAYTVTHAKGVPICFGAIPEKLNAGLACGMTVAQVMRLAIEDGGEVLSHGNNDEIVNIDNIDDLNFLYKKFVVNKHKFRDMGFNVRGCLRVGGTGNITGDARTDVWQRLLFDYGDEYGTAEPYSHARGSYSSDQAMYAAIDNALTNKTFLPIIFHGPASETVSDVIDYVLDNGGEIVTYAYAYDTYGSTVEEVEQNARLSDIEDELDGLDEALENLL